jgi:hypothetical protein
MNEDDFFKFLECIIKASSKVKTDNAEHSEEKRDNIPSGVLVIPEIVINSLAARLYWKREKVINYVMSIWEINHWAATEIMLREIAKTFDLRHSGDICHQTEVYVISSYNGHVYRLFRNDITTFKNFAAFRSGEEAKDAIKLLQSFFDIMFNNAKAKF